MGFTVVDWNVNGFVRSGQVDFLDSLDWDVACLQEITRATWPKFRDLAHQGDVAFDYLPALADRGPRYSCAVLTRGAVRLESFELLRDVPSPERAAVARLTLGGRALWVCSWAAPPGVSWGKAGKGRQVARFAAWLRARPGPAVVGIDRNAPKRERHDLADDEWWSKHEPLLYGPDRVHDLRDVYRDYLETTPDLKPSIRKERSEGPLAVTYRRGTTNSRYDAIYASPEFDVEYVEHLWNEAREAGSDHGLVRARLTWNRTSAGLAQGPG